jgi:hypothetical protein
LIYRNIIFKELDNEEQEVGYEGDMQIRGFQGKMSDLLLFFFNCLTNRVSGLCAQDQTTMITWPPTAAENTTHSLPEQGRSELYLPSVSISRLQPAHGETQETQETTSYNYSDASSIGRFPSFSFSLHSLTSLAALAKSGSGSRKATILVAALEVEGPDTITIKKGRDAGKQISLLKMILGDDNGTVCKLTAWRDVADVWGGNTTSLAVKRGDVCFIESML